MPDKSTKIMMRVCAVLAAIILILCFLKEPNLCEGQMILTEEKETAVYLCV